MTRLLIFICLLIISTANAQDSVKVKNRHGIPDTTKSDSIGTGALIDTINTTEKVEQQTKAMEVPADPESKIRNLENDISFIKAALKKTPNAGMSTQLASFENSKNGLKDRLNETKDSKTRDKWEKDFSELKLKVDEMKTKVH